MQDKQWIFKPINQVVVGELVQEYGMTPLAATVFQNRLELVSNDLTKLKGTAKSALHDPFKLKDMQCAVSRIKSAVAAKERITIYGDYDADGITSTAMLYTFLQRQGAIVDTYIPNRETEGYGVNVTAIDTIHARGTNLIITVDTGITAVEEAVYAKSLGMDFLVTDHHECKTAVPDCCAVINPKQPDCGYPFKQLAGVGVVFKLLCALSGDIGEILRSYSPLAAVGTIADVMPLTDENRAIVKFGLKYFTQPENIGLLALAESSGIAGKPLTAGSVSFSIAPRINAAGRLGDASKALTLFTTQDADQARELAAELGEENTKRQTIEKQILTEAVETIEKQELHKQNVIVLAKKGWHPGIVGIVASKITERYYRPCILLCIEGATAKGSGRSIEQFNLFDALTDAKELLEKYGGHALAAGLTISTDYIPDFRRRINDYAEGLLSPENLTPKLYIDCMLESGHLTMAEIQGLDRLKPYGMGNPTPIFCFSQARVTNIYTMTNGAHLRLILEKDGMSLTAVGFGLGTLADTLKQGMLIDIAGTVEINTYNGRQSLQMMIKDIKIP